MVLRRALFPGTEIAARLWRLVHQQKQNKKKNFFSVTCPERSSEVQSTYDPSISLPSSIFNILDDIYEYVLQSTTKKPGPTAEQKKGHIPEVPNCKTVIMTMNLRYKLEILPFMRIIFALTLSSRS
ncbi:hypothetical protein CDAR_387061 [Caerostris darwini]|uniref:Uncharacterized protein n=1 Tax=Caerostris darwini TaxID=1538125 RepID=A0AAV4RRE8_9ARAC|nr:hypothetical protein CDAR_387061 [Caerostris darwini]